MTKVGYYSPATAKIIHDVVRYLLQSGFIVDASRGHTTIPFVDAPIYVQNETGQTIPPYACLQTDGTEDVGGQNYIKVVKPRDTTGENGWFLFNGHAEIAASSQQKYGIAYDGPCVRMLTDGTTITNGDRWKPVVGSFAVTKGEEGDPFIAIGEDDIAENIMRGFIAPVGTGGGRMLMGKVTSQGTDESGDWKDLDWVQVTVIWGPEDLIATTVKIYDHSGDILDLDDLEGFSVWAFETVAASLDTEKECDELTPLFWGAVNRGCSRDNQIFRECE